MLGVLEEVYYDDRDVKSVQFNENAFPNGVSRIVNKEDDINWTDQDEDGLYTCRC